MVKYPTVEAAEAVKWSDGGFCLQNLQEPYHSECLHSDNALKSSRSGYGSICKRVILLNYFLHAPIQLNYFIR